MKNTRRRPRLLVSADGAGIVSQAGGVLVTRTAQVTGLEVGLGGGLGRWRQARAVHDPGRSSPTWLSPWCWAGDCLADVGILRAEPALFGPVASDPVVSRLVSRLAADAPRALKAIRAARAAARAWAMAGSRWRSCCGLGTPGRTRQPITSRRPGWAWPSCPPPAAPGTDPHRFRWWHPRVPGWLARPGRRLAYSVGFTITQDIQAAIGKIPATAWAPAYDGSGQVRDGAWVTEITGMLNLATWPKGMRVIVGKAPHPGAQLRFTDIDGHRFTCFVTSTKGGQTADLELRHRRRARCEDRIRCAKDTGLRNLPLHGFAQNQVGCEIVALACDLLAWSQLLALAGTPARRWEPKRLRLRLFSTAGKIVRGGRRLRLRLAARWPWAHQITAGLARLASLEPG